MTGNCNETTLAGTSRNALLCADVDEKLARIAAMARAFERGTLAADPDFAAVATDTPGRPVRPVLVAPRTLERRSTATAAGHAALVHAIAHIEFNAINLALDAICRFAGLPPRFYADWLRVAAEEATHFEMLRAHLRSLGFDYGDFPAHDGLWEMALQTAHDPLARMALVPRVLEARGLDVSPGMIRRLRAAADTRGAGIIEIILRDEVGHVAIGSHWFNHLCQQRGLDAEATFERLLHQHDAPRAVLPLNAAARRCAGFSDREIALIERVARGRTKGSPR